MLEAHFLLQFLVDPEADVDGVLVPDPHIEFPVMPFEPGLGDVIRGFDRPKESPVLRNRVQIGLFGGLPQLLLGGRGFHGIIEGVIFGVINWPTVPDGVAVVKRKQST